MCRRLVLVAMAVLVGLSGSVALAQCNCGAAATTYAPVAPSYPAYYPSYSYSAYYPSPVTYYAPTQVTYAPAAPVTYYAPVTPQVSYYAPAPAYATYYAPAVQPAAVYYYGVPGRSIFGAPRVYVPGQPVRNALKAVTP